MNRDLPLSERVQRAADSCELERVLSIHNYLHTANKAYEEWSTIWSKRDDTSWAHHFGRWIGFKSIWMGSVVDADEMAIETYRDLIEVYPQIAGMDYRPLACHAMHTLTNGIVEIADDGESARASYLTPGLLYNILDDSGHRRGAMMWERYGMDFVKEDGEWKFLHYQVCPDFTAPFDMTNHAETMYRNVKQGKEIPAGVGAKNLDEPGPLHKPTTPVQEVQRTCVPPVPYRTLNNDNTYTKFNCYADN